MLEVENLSFAYNGLPALNVVSFRVARGSVTALVGPNGSGKSTVLKCIANVLRPARGEVSIEGQPIARIKRRQLARCIAYVPQRVSMAFPMTAFDVALLGRRPHLSWRASPRDLDVTWQVLKAVGIDHLATRYINEMSGGEAQKVFVARALAQEAPILLLDEPTSNLDVQHQLEIMDLVRRLSREQGTTVLCAIHDLNLAARYADTIVMLQGGRVYAEGTPEQVLTPKHILEVYGVQAKVKKDADGLHVFCTIRTESCT